MINSSKATILIIGQGQEGDSGLMSIIAGEEEFVVHQAND
jgi:hypothetical protein